MPEVFDVEYQLKSKEIKTLMPLEWADSYAKSSCVLVKPSMPMLSAKASIPAALACCMSLS